jgi:cell division protein ZapA (FtsZ GTPase activity inhibitor)
VAETIKVNILGSDYPLRSNDESLTRELAGEVDSMLREYQQKLPSQSTTTLAVLTALNFAEQEAHAKENERRQNEVLAEDLNNLCDDLEKALNP